MYMSVCVGGYVSVHMWSEWLILCIVVALINRVVTGQFLMYSISYYVDIMPNEDLEPVIVSNQQEFESSISGGIPFLMAVSFVLKLSWTFFCLPPL